MVTGRELRLGDRVRITGGVSAKGKAGQVVDLGDAVFVGVRISEAKEVTYVTYGSVATSPQPQEKSPSRPAQD